MSGPVQDGADQAVDVLFDGTTFHEFAGPFHDTKHTHGTGCTYASAIAANLSRGFTLLEAVDRATRYVGEAIRHGLPIGQGHGPTHHFYFMEDSGIFPAGDG